MKHGFILLLSLFCQVSLVLAQPAVDLQKEFENPPDSAKAWTWWHRVNGFITKEGITRDLEAMKRGGLGGAQMFDVSGKLEPAGTAVYLSPEWLELTKFCITEADRLGLKLGMHNSSGWSSSGGPWVKPEDSMQILVSTETHASGPSRFDQVLPQPKANYDCYADSAVVAFPLVGNKNPTFAEMPPAVTSTAPDFKPEPLFDNDPKTLVKIPLPTPEKPQYFQFEFPKPYTAQALSLDPGNLGLHGEVQYSEDGEKYVKVRDFWIRGARGRRSFSFPPVTARYFRIVFTKPDRPYYTALDFSELVLSSEALIDDYEQKAGYQPYPKDKSVKPQKVAQDDIIPRSKVVDLTGKMKPDGRLEWDVPEGKWVILRLGHTPLGGEGNKNHPASIGGQGLEVDKFDADAVKRFWAGGPARVIAEAGPLAGSVLTDMVIDSYERGQQNWTAKFPQEFENRRGYSLVPFYPTLTGRVVGSVDESERFLWDVRRTIADLFAENYAGTFADLSHQHKMIFALESAGFVADQLQYLGKSDMPMAVTWMNDDPPLIYSQASAGHVYGKKLVGGEVMTSQPADDNWKSDPYNVKAKGDAAFCAGINRFVFHTFAHQPWEKFPGMTAGKWGSHFDRGNTWWEQGRDWRIYLARCQHLLQQGHNVAEGMFFSGESVPSSAPVKGAKLEGYLYDGCNAEIIIKHLTVKDGKLVLPNGASYAFLSILDVREMTLPLVKRIKELVEQGATVIGSKPISSPSLTGYPQVDQEVQAIANEVWGPCDGDKVREHVFGKGRIIWGQSLDDVLLKILNIQPDFTYASAGKEPDIRFAHRRTPDADIYFISNQEDNFVQIDGSFRMDGKLPELWWGDTGKTEAAPVYQIAAGRTKVPLALEPRGSVFVVFRKPAEGDHIVSLTAAGVKADAEPSYGVSTRPDNQVVLKAWKSGAFDIQKSDGKKERVSIEGVPDPVAVSGSWDLTFPPNLGAPPKVTFDKLISYTEHGDKGVKYFAGTATYAKKLTLAADLFGEGRSIYLDLGEVKNIAQVKVNGQDLGVLWKPPFRVDITKAAQPGENAVEIAVTNLWPNRLIGDEQLPPDSEWAGDGGIKEIPQWVVKGGQSPNGRVAFSVWHHWNKDDKLLPSGLLGPVRISVAQSKAIP